MFKLRYLITFIAISLVMSACTENKESQDKPENQVGVEQSSFQSDEMMTREDIAEHLANLAVKVKDVEDAAAIVVGPYTVVGLDINQNVKRQETSTIKHTVLEALEHDPYGRQAVVIADADVTSRLRGMRDAIQNGEPVKGIADELANIVSRYMPTLPKENEKGDQDIIREDQEHP